MAKIYKQLSQKERDRIFLLKQKGKTNKDIAKIIGRDKSTIGRELKRNKHKKFNQYLPDTAERKANKRKRRSRKKNSYKEEIVYLKGFETNDEIIKKSLIDFSLS